MVAATPSAWSGAEAGDTGVWLGTRLQSFNTWPDHPNVIAPGKRPRITLTPTLVLDEENRPVMAVSVAALTVYDMCKSVDRGMSIGPIQLEEKLGGRSGHWRREETSVGTVTKTNI